MTLPEFVMWTGRDVTEPFRVTVVREDPAPEPIGYTPRVIEVWVAPGSSGKLAVNNTSIRSHSLSD